MTAMWIAWFGFRLPRIESRWWILPPDDTTPDVAEFQPSGTAAAIAAGAAVSDSN
jgi:hypothetical protein